jgi:hypothetical protein
MDAGVSLLSPFPFHHGCFVRVKLDAFINENKLQAMDREQAEDDFVFVISLFM